MQATSLEKLSDQNPDIALVAKAVKFAVNAHGEQVRKYTGEPYWNHPYEVMQILERYNAPAYVRAAAMLHDVVEDTPVEIGEIIVEFGQRVAELVLEVTDVSTPEDGNRAQRKRKDLLHLAKASPWGAMIKLADLISNTKTIVEHDPSFAQIYLTEKEEALKVLMPKDLRLLNEANEVIWQARRKLGVV